MELEQPSWAFRAFAEGPEASVWQVLTLAGNIFDVSRLSSQGRGSEHGVGVRVRLGEAPQKHPLPLHPPGLLLVLQKPGGLHH